MIDTHNMVLVDIRQKFPPLYHIKYPNLGEAWCGLRLSRTDTGRHFAQVDRNLICKTCLGSYYKQRNLRRT